MYVEQKHNWNQEPSLLERIFDMIATAIRDKRINASSVHAHR